MENALSIKTILPPQILKMKGLSGRKFRIMINSLVNLIDNPRYLEIGCWLGSTACSASFKNNLKITCVDNWSQNFLYGVNPEVEFNNNIKKFLSKKSKLTLINNDFRKIKFSNLKKHNIFFFDGPHHYEDHYDAIEFTLTAMENNFIMIIDDWNWKQVREATFDSIRSNKLKILSSLEIRTTLDDSSALIVGEKSDWHQGCIFFNIQK